MEIKSIVQLDPNAEKVKITNFAKYEFYSRLVKYYPEFNQLLYNGNVLFQFNSLLDMEYFFTVFLSCDLCKFSKNRLQNFNTEELIKEREKDLKPDFIKTLSYGSWETESYFLYKNRLKVGYHPLVFYVADCVDLFHTKFDETIMNQLLTTFGADPIYGGYKRDGDEIITPEKLQNYMINEFIDYLENTRSSTLVNLPIIEFQNYVQQRTALSSDFATQFYQSNMEMMSIELSYFFPYKEDLIDFIECLKKTGMLFKEKGIEAYDRSASWGIRESLHKPEVINSLKKLIDYYLPTLLENLSYQATLLSSLNKQ
jgi:hypothetical protein